MYSTEEITQRFNKAKTERSMFQTQFDDCYDYAMPRRMTLSDKTVGQDRMDKIFDETAVTGVQEFASKLQSGLIPDFRQWADLKMGSSAGEKEDALKEKNEALGEINDLMFEHLHSSNFSGQAHETFLDLSIGTGNLLFEEGQTSDDPFKFTAIGLPHYVMDVDPSGNVHGMFRERKMRWRDVPHEYPAAKNLPNGDKDAEATLIDVVTSVPGRDHEYERHVCAVEDNRAILNETYKGRGSNPYITFRWSKIPGERYGRGPLMDCLPAIKTLNLTMQLILENAQMAISGVYNIEDDGVLNADTIQLVPGALIPHAPGSQGMRPIPQAGNFDVSQLLLQEFRTNVKRALFLDMLGDPDRTPASATEIAARQSELAARIGSSFARLHTEFVTPVLERAAYILKKKGMIEMPSVDGKKVKIIAKSPLAARFQQEEVGNYVNYAQLLNQLYGPQIAMAIMDQQAGAEWLSEKLNVADKLNRSDEEKKKMMQMLQQAMQVNPEETADTARGIGPAPVQ